MTHSAAVTPEFRERAEKEMQQLRTWTMPFGKYKGRLLIELPDAYFIWFANKGYPRGELGRMMQLAYEIRLNGLEYLFK